MEERLGRVVRTRPWRVWPGVGKGCGRPGSPGEERSLHSERGGGLRVCHTAISASVPSALSTGRTWESPGQLKNRCSDDRRARVLVSLV